MSQEESVSIELPGVGEVRARPGTSTAEMAGMVKYWHDKCQSARTDGFLAGITLLGMAELLITGLYFLLR